MTRVLILQGTIPPYRVPFFDRLGREVDLVVAHSDPAARVAATDFAATLLRDRGPGPFHLQAGVGRLARGFDAVVAMFDLRWLSSLALCLSPRRPAFVWWGHGYGRSPIGARLRDAFVARGDALLLYDERTRDAFVAAGHPAERLFVAPNTVEVEAPFCVEDPRARERFLFVGRLQERKRLDLLLEAFARIADRLPPEVAIDIVGEGPPRAALRARAEALGIAERVDFHGEIRDEATLRTVFGRALAYVSPGAVGLGVLHACAYGVGTLASRGDDHGPELASLHDGETGLLVERSAPALADAMLRLARDRTEAQRLGRAAFEHYTTCRRPEQMVAGFLDALAFARRAA